MSDVRKVPMQLKCIVNKYRNFKYMRKYNGTMDMLNDDPLTICIKDEDGDDFFIDPKGLTESFEKI